MFSLDFEKKIEKLYTVADYLAEHYGLDTSRGSAFTCINPDHEDAHPSMGIDPNTGRAHCFSCGSVYNLRQCIEVLEGLNREDAIRRAAALAGLSEDEIADAWLKGDASEYRKGPQTATESRQEPGQTNTAGETERSAEPATAPARAEEPPEPPALEFSPLDFSEAVASGEKLLFTKAGQNALDYLHGRGFTDETIQKNHACLSAGWNSFTEGQPVDLRAGVKSSYYSLMFPFEGPDGRYSYVQGEIANRNNVGLILTYADRDGKERKTAPLSKYIKPRGVADQIYNEQYLLKEEGAPAKVFICEGIYDAWSVEQAGGHALALMGAKANHGRLAALIREGKCKRTLFYIGLDNDAAGKEAGAALRSLLQRAYTKGLIKGYASTAPLYTGHKSDWNDALKKRPEALEDYIKSLMQAATSEQAQQAAQAVQIREQMLADSGGGRLNDFFEQIRTDAAAPCTSTGFPQLDDALGGGLYPGLYAIGALSSLGKTTYIMQMADHIAMQERDVLIFSLEMAAHELMAKSLSRHSFEIVRERGLDDSIAKTTRGVLTGQNEHAYNRDEKRTLSESIQRYAAYSEHVIIKEGLGNIGIREIKQAMLDYETAFPGRPAPVVIVDYLQILEPLKDTLSDKQAIDKNVLELKRISRDHKTPVIIVSSLNRASYRGSISETAFKESGAIEYGCDVLMGLQYAAADNDPDNWKLETERKKHPREVQLKVMKNRNGQLPDPINYLFYAKFNKFLEAE